MNSEHPLKAWRLRQRMADTRWGRDAVLTITEAARRGGWPGAMWHSWEKFPWEKGHAMPSPANMVKLCDMTGLMPNDFYFKARVPYRTARGLDRQLQAG